MRRLLLFTLILAPFFSSCEKQTEEIVYEDYQSNTLLRQIKASEEDMEVITYYNTSSVFEHVGTFSYRKFLYNTQNQLIKIETALSFNPLSCAIIPGETYDEGDDPRTAPINFFVEYEYLDNGNLKIKNAYNINDGIVKLTSYSKYVYEDDKVTKIEIYNPQDQLTQYNTYIYDDIGNVSKEEYYFIMDEAEAVLQSQTIYEYDDKNNPFIAFAVEGTPGTNTNVNNITRQVMTHYYDGEETSYSEFYSYEYNDLGYPVKANNLEYIYGKEE